MDEKGIFPTDELSSREKKRRRKSEPSSFSRLISDQASESSGGRNVIISVVENRSREVCVCKMDFSAVRSYFTSSILCIYLCVRAQ
jgi:hypothetical protein